MTVTAKVLIADWREAWKFFSMWGAAAVVAWASLPEAYQIAVLELLGISSDRLLGIMGLAIMIGRILHQGTTPGVVDAPNK